VDQDQQLLEILRIADPNLTLALLDGSVWVNGFHVLDPSEKRGGQLSFQYSVSLQLLDGASP